jgi:hypothetical protein
MYSDSLCSFIARELPVAKEEVKERMIAGMDKAPNIIIYPSVDQFYESNIGSFEPALYTLPTLVAKGNRLVLSFTGSYSDLKSQLREGIARNVWEHKMKENNVEGQVKGRTGEQAIPAWFKEGAVRYFANGWPLVAEDELKYLFRNHNFKSWYDVINSRPKLSGQALCYFLSEVYYRQAPAQIFNQLKKKDLGRSLRLLTKKEQEALFEQCFQYYTDRFKEDNNRTILSMPIAHEPGILKEILCSPDEKVIAYTLLAKGKRTVYTYSRLTNKTNKIVSYNLPPWISDHSKDIYPILRWSDNGRELLIAMPVKGKIAINRYTPEGSAINGVKFYGVDGISNFNSMSDGQYLLSATRRGQEDIVAYNDKREKYIPFTNDIYEDNSPVVIDGAVYITSNRPKDSIHIKNKTLPKLFQGIYSVKDNNIKPIVIDSNEYTSFGRLKELQDGKLLAEYSGSGTQRLSVIDKNGAIKQGTDIQTYQYLKGTNRVLIFKTDKDSIRISSQPFNEWLAEHGNTSWYPSPWLKDFIRRKQEDAAEDSILNKAKENGRSVLDDVFAAAYSKDSTTGKKKAEENVYDSKTVKPYILQLHSAYFSAKVNNDYFGNRYQPYQNYQGQFKFPEVGAMAQGGFTDLFENHHISIAYRFPVASEGSNFFVSYLNTKKKTDWGLSYYRNVEQLKPDPTRYWVNADGKPYPSLAKVKTHYYEVSAHHPLTYEMGLEFQQAIRTDRTIFQAADRYSLEFPDIKSTWSITTLSFNLIKLKPTVPLLYKGFQVTAILDGFKGFSYDESALMGATIQGEYHLPLYKYITLVAKGKVGYSAGDKNVLYILGGTDNNVAPKIDSSIQFSQTAPYAFQTLITPFRGYLQNSVYGNQYALFNFDVYFPLFETLIPVETPLPAINQLQLGIFSDIGTAKETWRGAINTVGNWNVSYGLSARTILAGYPLRLEVAWPGTFSKKPVWYFSLSIK